MIRLWEMVVILFSIFSYVNVMSKFNIIKKIESMVFLF